ncbi:3-hydroxyacyl-CoA dehydrogenase NAD-binding domain-containing protein [Croceicoccus naphthovorans]|uniref:3-hydroxyacyl-CoA dehydrogenase n=1 Tax=Croceicoccus naphthovorans TaxID=1348774 RepID=A0A0G3XDF2_9SPHN|nr:3-hydroxyacyl-CoA dehydrogenase NAD-binding domain-containing protein [Croceicoccus naphthovorans]AKM09560.1 3-hydroxyacyl-CoA dehydrogenase [Croceicoccus naphthovorans]MBB3989674.1 3-hydroxyacyl-CoA dehydrogenase [Croceicoccus naphthovorans]
MSESLSETVSLSVVDGIATVLIDNPPVNALGATVRKGLVAAAEKIASDTAIKAAVLTAKARTFPAGADIAEFATGMTDPWLPEVVNTIEALEKPVVAAIYGTALGGGLEVALGCHYRVAAASAKLGVPEVQLGLLPGAGGTQRLPRIVGAEAALQMMVTGKPIKAPLAEKMGLVDKVVADDALMDEALAMAKAVMAKDGPLPRVSEMTEWTEKDRADSDLLDKFRAEHGRMFRGVIAPDHILETVRAAIELPFAEGMAVENERFMTLFASDQSRALRHVFFAMRETAKVPDIAKDTPLIDVKSVGVIGAGTMGGGIAMCFANIGIPVTIVEVKQEALDRGLGVIRKNYENTAKKGRMTAEDVETRMGLLTGSLNMEDLGDKDLIIEAVFESMEIKEKVFSRLDTIAKPGAILASNTSYLDIDHIATFTSRPEMVLGLHFFSPANVMPLLEIVRGEKSSDSVIATGMKLAKAIRKTPVLARVCDGFIANRLMYPYIDLAIEMLVAGTPMQVIDSAMRDYGFAMGPLQMLDLVGLDVITFPAEVNVTGELVKLERRGQKLNGGFYDYDEKRRGTPAPAAIDVVDKVRKHRGIAGDKELSPEQVMAGLLYPVVNEGAKILEEGIAMRAGDIDVAAILGYNWPAYQGGPMCWADIHGLPKIVAGLEAMGQKPAALLKKLASEGGSFT